MKKSAFVSVLVVAILLVGCAAYAMADTVTTNGSGSPLAASDLVTVKANVQTKLVLAVTTPNGTQTVDFGSVFPGVAQTPQVVNLAVWSNKGFTIVKDKTADNTIGLTTSMAASTAHAAQTTLAENAAGTPFADTYNLNVPYSVAPGAITQTITYTVTQN